jgi:hypothetical protein
MYDPRQEFSESAVGLRGLSPTMPAHLCLRRFYIHLDIRLYLHMPE